MATAHATGQYSTRALAQRFGVAPSTINRALNRYKRSP
jgi:transposase